MKKGVLALAISVFVVTGCATTANGPVVESGPRYSAAADSMENYRLAAGDKVRITIYDEAALSGEYAVGTNGVLSFPLAGDIPADGKTPKEVGVAIQTRLADGYLRDPKVSVEIVSYRPFFILGEVGAPGQYPYASGMTAFNAVATAQGFSPRADKKTIFIRQAGGVEEQAYRLTPDLKVLPGDTIRVAERFF